MKTSGWVAEGEVGYPKRGGWRVGESRAVEQRCDERCRHFAIAHGCAIWSVVLVDKIIHALEAHASARRTYPLCSPRLCSLVIGGASSTRWGNKGETIRRRDTGHHDTALTISGDTRRPCGSDRSRGQKDYSSYSIPNLYRVSTSVTRTRRGTLGLPRRETAGRPRPRLG